MYLEPIAKGLGIDTSGSGPVSLFRSIIEVLGQEKEVVILIDEYEMAIADFVGNDEKRVQDNIFTLKKFYATMKGAGCFIHSSYITGVSKIGHLGALAELSIVNDLSLDERFSTLFGFTEAELRHYFAAYIAEAAKKLRRTEEEILNHIKFYYNGYSWDGISENRVSNPFAIVNFFQSSGFQSYWFDTGTPTTLVKGVKHQGLTMIDLENLKTGADLLGSANLKELYSVSLLFQAGYLTMKSIRNLGWKTEYTLGFPNHEVRYSFAKHLLAEYVGKAVDYTDHTLIFKLRMHLENQELKPAFQVFAPVIASTGYDVVKRSEGYFHTIMHVLMYSTGLTTFSEVQSLEGRLDTICIAFKAIYIFEFKLDGSAEGALAQIKAQGYAKPFIAQPKALYLIGVNFVSAEKRIDQVLVEKWDGEKFVGLEGDFTPVEEGE